MTPTNTAELIEALERIAEFARRYDEVSNEDGESYEDDAFIDEIEWVEDDTNMSLPLMLGDLRKAEIARAALASTQPSGDASRVAELEAENEKLRAMNSNSETWDSDAVGITSGDPLFWSKMADHARKRIIEGEKWMTISMAQYEGLLIGMHQRESLRTQPSGDVRELVANIAGEAYSNYVGSREIRLNNTDSAWHYVADEILAALANPQSVTELLDENDALRARVKELKSALGWFLSDERFHVAVGGNPSVVEDMIERARDTMEAGDG